MSIKAKQAKIKELRGMQGFKIKMYRTTKEQYLETKLKKKELSDLLKQLSAEIADIDKARFKLGDLKPAPEIDDEA